ncbi:membrane protein [Thalassobaculum fulvum]|uniref:Membrane protein n=1 Tax=Thalassobaculum fulvum TaxID=1633335 RepID=A0A918XTC1_9PROT|nr:tripartite tricarboxylate transporter TctB family protein [Thalassobaculum fulvum]GHD53274.1 membrane protein [Thalassobaculum fulvum]
MSDRLTGLLIAALAIWYGWTANNFEEGFGDPVGPSAFPKLLAVPMGLFALYLVIRPDADPDWPRGNPLIRQGVMLAALVVYPLILEPLGFPLATALAIFIMAVLLRGTRRAAGVAAVAISLGLFVTFDQILGLHLPMLPSLQ